MDEKKHIWIRMPTELKREIVALVGPRKLSAFFVEAVEREFRWRGLLVAETKQGDSREAEP